MMRNSLGIGLLCIASAAQAGDKPLFQPVPDWVKPAPPLDASALTDASPVVLMLDDQQRLQDGQVWTYIDSAIRVASTQALGSVGTFQLPWRPDQGDLIVHRAEIIRGTQHIDLLKDGDKFTVLHREQQLDRQSLDGVLTATMPVPDMRVGDVLHLTYSTTARDPTLKGGVQTNAVMIVDPTRVQFARLRLLWPKTSNIHWKSFTEGVSAKPVDLGAYRELTIPMPLPKPVEMPGDAPLRFKTLPVFEATSFESWAGVADVMTPLYATNGLIAPGSPLAAEVAKIAAAESDPLKRAALATQLVQDKVRYLLVGLGTGNYVPQTPAQTWQLRYGDCKAKTLLLLAILHDLGVTAEPALASIKLSGLVAQQLPAPLAFDHVVVRATVGGKVYWLDGTALGTRMADLADTPPFRTVLPLHPGSATLETIETRAPARADLATTIDLDERAGLNLPAPFRVAVTFRGGQAEQIRVAFAQGGKDELRAATEKLLEPLIGTVTLATDTVDVDAASGTTTLNATGLAYPAWEKDDDVFRTKLDPVSGSITFAPDRSRPAWTTIPVATGNPAAYTVRRTVHLPLGGTGFTVEGKDFDGQIGPSRIVRTIKRTADTITIDIRAKDDGREIAASAIPALRQQVAIAVANPPRAVAPVSYPPFWRDVTAARQEHRLDPILAVYTQRIAASPKEAVRYTDRAWFLEEVYDRKAAIVDLSQALTLNPDVDTYLRRGALHEALGDKAKALADAKAAHILDPSSDDAMLRVANLLADTGDRPGATAMIEERLDAGGESRATFASAKATLQSEGGQTDAALATIDAAIAKDPGKPDLLNARCWIKGTGNVALDTALKDCTKAIELTDAPNAALDSRGMAYFRLKRFDDALADYDAVLKRDPSAAGSLYMRGVVRLRMGSQQDGAADIAAARIVSPQIDADYKRFGIVP